MTKYKSFEENEDQRIENEADEDLDEEYELKKMVWGAKINCVICILLRILFCLLDIRWIRHGHVRNTSRNQLES